MPLLTTEQARAQCRIDTLDFDAELDAYVEAAEDAAAAYLNRTIFADEVSWTTAIDAVPAEMQAAQAASDASEEAAEAMTDEAQQAYTLEVAAQKLQRAEQEAARTIHGVVVNASILAAVRLIVGHLWANRESVVIGEAAIELPMGAHALLRPYRRVMMP